jgi:hypothetical protein
MSFSHGYRKLRTLLTAAYVVEPVRVRLRRRLVHGKRRPGQCILGANADGVMRGLFFLHDIAAACRRVLQARFGIDAAGCGHRDAT